MAASSGAIEAINLKKTPDELLATSKYLLGLYSELTGEYIEVRQIFPEKFEKARMNGTLIQRVPLDNPCPLRLMFDLNTEGTPTVFKQMIEFIKDRCIVRDDEFITIKASDLLRTFSEATGITLHNGTAFPKLMKNVMILYPSIHKKLTAKGVFYNGICLKPLS